MYRTACGTTDPFMGLDIIELDTHEISEPNVGEPDTLKTHILVSSLSSGQESTLVSPGLASNTRKRSLNSGKVSSYSTKRVHFTPEIEAASIVQKPELGPLPYEADVEIEEGVVVKTEVVIEEKVFVMEVIIVEEIVDVKSGEEVIVKGSTLSPIEGFQSTLDLVKSCYSEEDEVDYGGEELKYGT